MLTKERCEVFQQSLDNVKTGLHLLPSEALFDSMAYFYKIKENLHSVNMGKNYFQNQKNPYQLPYNAKNKEGVRGKSNGKELTEKGLQKAVLIT